MIERLSHKKLIYLVDFLMWINIAATGFCRLYLGRHSVDQVLVGCLLGIITAYFFHYEMRPIVYETLNTPRWNHGFFTSLIALNMIS